MSLWVSHILVECVSLCVRVFMDVSMCMCMIVRVIVPVTICICVPIHVGEGGSALDLIVVFALCIALCATQRYEKYHINKV